MLDIIYETNNTVGNSCESGADWEKNATFICGLQACSAWCNVLPKPNLSPFWGNFPGSVAAAHGVFGSDALAGRGTGTPGELAAADYIRGVFRRYNLQSPLTNGRLFSNDTHDGSLPLAESVLRIHYNEKIIDLNLGSDYLLMKTGPQTFVSQPVEMVLPDTALLRRSSIITIIKNTDVRGKIVARRCRVNRHRKIPHILMEKQKVFTHCPEAKLRQAIFAERWESCWDCRSILHKFATLGAIAANLRWRCDVGISFRQPVQRGVESGYRLRIVAKSGIPLIDCARIPNRATGKFYAEIPDCRLKANSSSGIFDHRMW